jgi:hypothetical protein
MSNKDYYGAPAGAPPQGYGGNQQYYPPPQGRISRFLYLAASETPKQVVHSSSHTIRSSPNQRMGNSSTRSSTGSLHRIQYMC